MLLDNRVLFSDNGVVADLSPNQNNFVSGSDVIDVIAADDALYIGSTLPFNHRHVSVGVVNANASVLTVAMWDGSAWNDAVDILDQTALAGVSLAQSGHISWVLPKTKVWKQDDTENVTGLTSVSILGLYWARFKWSADLTATTAISSVAFRFSNDEDLGSEYPELEQADTKSQFESGKTDWSEQHYRAAEIIIRDMKSRLGNQTLDPNQIIRFEQLKDASIYKMAEMVFRAFGDDWLKNRDDAKNLYTEAMNNVQLTLDRNRNTRRDSGEAIPDLRVIRRA